MEETQNFSYILDSVQEKSAKIAESQAIAL